tara:strand:+ start:15174 stop:17495 length:2322 start_codon:yes stop_codon:yes gene_type:complete
MKSILLSLAFALSKVTAGSIEPATVNFKKGGIQWDLELTRDASTCTPRLYYCSDNSASCRTALENYFDTTNKNMTQYGLKDGKTDNQIKNYPGLQSEPTIEVVTDENDIKTQMESSDLFVLSHRCEHTQTNLKFDTKTDDYCTTNAQMISVIGYTPKLKMGFFVPQSSEWDNGNLLLATHGSPDYVISDHAKSNLSDYYYGDGAVDNYQECTDVTKKFDYTSKVAKYTQYEFFDCYVDKSALNTDVQEYNITSKQMHSTWDLGHHTITDLTDQSVQIYPEAHRATRDYTGATGTAMSAMSTDNRARRYLWTSEFSGNKVDNQDNMPTGICGFTSTTRIENPTMVVSYMEKTTGDDINIEATKQVVTIPQSTHRVSFDGIDVDGVTMTLVPQDLTANTQDALAQNNDTVSTFGNATVFDNDAVFTLSTNVAISIKCNATLEILNRAGLTFGDLIVLELEVNGCEGVYGENPIDIEELVYKESILSGHDFVNICEQTDTIEGTTTNQQEFNGQFAKCSGDDYTIPYPFALDSYEYGDTDGVRPGTDSICTVVKNRTTTSSCCDTDTQITFEDRGITDIGWDDLPVNSTVTINAITALLEETGGTGTSRAYTAYVNSNNASCKLDLVGWNNLEFATTSGFDILRLNDGEENACDTITDFELAKRVVNDDGWTEYVYMRLPYKLTQAKDTESNCAYEVNVEYNSPMIVSSYGRRLNEVLEGISWNGGGLVKDTTLKDSHVNMKDIGLVSFNQTLKQRFYDLSQGASETDSYFVLGTG